VLYVTASEGGHQAQIIKKEAAKYFSTKNLFYLFVTDENI